tara:strand:- start:1513 stop:2121 length:609 start_codon:yes stop_codon:yes gene_type:complete
MEQYNAQTQSKYNHRVKNDSEHRINELKDRANKFSNRLNSHRSARKQHEYDRVENDEKYKELIVHVANDKYNRMTEAISNDNVINILKIKKKKIDEDLKNISNRESQSSNISKESSRKLNHSKQHTKHSANISQTDINNHVLCYKSNTLYGNTEYNIDNIPTEYKSLLTSKFEFTTKVNMYNLMLDVKKWYEKNKSTYPMLF